MGSRMYTYSACGRKLWDGMQYDVLLQSENTDDTAGVEMRFDIVSIWIFKQQHSADIPLSIDRNLYAGHVIRVIDGHAVDPSTCGSRSERDICWKKQCDVSAPSIESPL